jgi:Domain of unknown function (DUF3883)
MEFEENDTPQRFPIRVANVTGWRAPGVDVLSFASEQDRRHFLAGDRRESLVERFIEVKGRSTEGATVDLRGNELAAAQRHREKYFLYRIFDRGDESYGLAILRNPLSDETGLATVYEVNLDAATRTEQFRIDGGLARRMYEDTIGRRDEFYTRIEQ